MPGPGYLLATKNGVTGESGVFYDYLLGENGLFLSAKNSALEVTICIAPTQVRGLAPVTERVQIIHGLIPRRLYELAFSTCLIRPIKERYFGIIWRDGEYHLEYPEQDGTPGGVSYQRPDKPILDIHSHGEMKAFFSETDNQDEQGFILSLVLGRSIRYLNTDSDYAYMGIEKN
jgi:PRTRC genetic system protein A